MEGPSLCLVVGEIIACDLQVPGIEVATGEIFVGALDVVTIVTQKY